MNKIFFEMKKQMDLFAIKTFIVSHKIDQPSRMDKKTDSKIYL